MFLDRKVWLAGAKTLKDMGIIYSQQLWLGQVNAPHQIKPLIFCQQVSLVSRLQNINCGGVICCIHMILVDVSELLREVSFSMDCRL